MYFFEGIIQFIKCSNIIYLFVSRACYDNFGHICMLFFRVFEVINILTLSILLVLGFNKRILYIHTISGRPIIIEAQWYPMELLYSFTLLSYSILFKTRPAAPHSNPPHR